MLDPDCSKCKELDTEVKKLDLVVKGLQPAACIEVLDRRSESWKTVCLILLLVCISEAAALGLLLAMRV